MKIAPPVNALHEVSEEYRHVVRIELRVVVGGSNEQILGQRSLSGTEYPVGIS
jgi:hypothetical protein